MIFGIENHENPSHYDLHIKNFNSDELKFLIEYQYKLRDSGGAGAVLLRFASPAFTEDTGLLPRCFAAEADP